MLCPWGLAEGSLGSYRPVRCPGLPLPAAHSCFADIFLKQTMINRVSVLRRNHFFYDEARFLRSTVATGSPGRRGPGSRQVGRAARHREPARVGGRTMPRYAGRQGRGEENRDRLLRLLHQRSPVTRATIGRVLRLSPAAVSHLLHRLLVEGLVVEEDLPEGQRQTSRGRRPSAIRLNPRFAQAIGLEVTDVEVHGVLVDFAAQPLVQVHHRLPALLNPQGVLAALETVARSLMHHPLRGETPLLGLGVGVHGVVDPERGVSHTFPPMEAWRDVPVARLLAQRLGLPVFLDFRLYAATLAELLHGEGRHHRCFAYLNAADGATLGLGYVEGGRILRGQLGLVGQLGHLCVEPDGRRCFCGSRGCLITVASPRAVVERAQEEIRAGVETSLAAVARRRAMAGESLVFSDLVQAFHQRDKLAVDLLAQAAHYLGLGIAHAVNLLNPAVVILGGVLAGAGDEFVHMIDRTVARHTVPRAYQQTVLKPSRLGAQAGALGAAALVIQRLVEERGIEPPPPVEAVL